MVYTKIKNLYANIKNSCFDESNNLIIQLQLILALLGSAVLISGVFCPFINAPFLGVVDYTRIGKYYDEIVIACGVSSVILALLKLYRWVIIPTVGALSVIVFSIYNIYRKVGMLRERIDETLYNNPYKELLITFIDSIEKSISFQWGIIILTAGIVLLITSAVMKNKEIIIPLKKGIAQSDI